MVGLFWLRLGWDPEPAEAADDKRPQLLDFESFTFAVSLAILKPESSALLQKLDQHLSQKLFLFNAISSHK